MRWVLLLGLLALFLGATKAHDEGVEALEQEDQFDGFEAELSDSQEEEETQTHLVAEVATNDREDASDMTRFREAPATDKTGAMKVLRSVNGELEEANAQLEAALSQAKEANPSLFRFSQQEGGVSVDSEDHRASIQTMLDRIAELARAQVEKAQQLIATVEHNKQYLSDKVVAEYSAKGVDCLNGALETLRQCQMQVASLNALSANSAAAELPNTEEAASTSFVATVDSINNPVLNPEEIQPESHLMDEEVTEPRFSQVDSEEEDARNLDFFDT